jgi:hypothetical protein
MSGQATAEDSTPLEEVKVEDASEEHHSEENENLTGLLDSEASESEGTSDAKRILLRDEDCPQTQISTHVHRCTMPLVGLEDSVL